MSRKTTVLGVSFALAASLAAVPTMATAAPSEQTSAVTTTTATTEAQTPQEKIEALLAQSNLPADAQQKIRDAAAKLPSNWTERQELAQEKYGVQDSEWHQIAGSAIDPDQYQCEPTELSAWLGQQMQDPGVALGLNMLSMFGATDLPTYDALLFGSQSKWNSFGVDGDYTTQLNREMKNLRSFWDVPSDIELIPMHGDMLSERDRVVRGYEVVYGLPTPIAELYADIVEVVLENVPALKGGDHPLLSFNAFAFDPQGDPVLTEMGVTKRIVMGDGIMAGLEGIGLDDKAAPLGVLSHEYAHQVQYAKDLFDSPLTGPEATRRTELMADAFGTYQVVHARGASLNTQRTLDVMQSFYSVGDCSFSSDGHHGTPNQRMKASEWAADLVDSRPNQGHKLSSDQMTQRFEQQLPKIVAPDA